MELLSYPVILLPTHFDTKQLMKLENNVINLENNVITPYMHSVYKYHELFLLTTAMMVMEVPLMIMSGRLNGANSLINFRR